MKNKFLILLAILLSLFLLFILWHIWDNRKLQKQQNTILQLKNSLNNFTIKNDTKEERGIAELVIIDSNFLSTLNILIAKHKKCGRFIESHPWEVYIEDVKDDRKIEAKSIYICQSFDHTKTIKGYGFFYFKNILFMVIGEKIPDIFLLTNKRKDIEVAEKPEPIIFDPPRAFYYYFNKKIILGYIAPCGG